MSRRSILALLMVPALLIGSPGARASDVCAALKERFNQMPEIIGSGGGARYKAESVFRLNRIEIALRGELRKLDCPTASVVEWSAGDAAACSDLGQKLADVLAAKQRYTAFQPVMSQTVDDGTGILPALRRQLHAAHCDVRGTQEDVEIISSTTAAENPRQVAVVTTYGEGDQPVVLSDGETRQDLSAILGDSEANATPEAYGMIQLSPRDAENAQKLARVELPKLEGQELETGAGSIDRLHSAPAPGQGSPDAAQAAQPPMPLRDYDSTDRKVRRVGPAFLAEKEDGIDLRNPAPSVTSDLN